MSGLALSVSGWTGATLGVKPGAYATETWLASTSFSDGKGSLVEVMDDIVSWANDAARAWTGAETYSWSLTDPGVGLLDGFIGVTLTGTASTVYTATAAFTTQTGISSATATSVSSGAATTPPGTMSAAVKVTGGRRYLRDVGSRSPGGAFMQSAPTFAPKPLRLSTVLTESDVYALSQAISNAASPTRGHVYDVRSASWVELAAVGNIEAPARGVQLYTVTFPAYQVT